MKMSNEKLYFKPEYVIVNLIQADKKTYLPIGRLYKFVSYLWEQISEEEGLQIKRDVVFNVNFDSIERSVQYNSKVFDLVGDMIFVKTDNINEYIKTPDNEARVLSKYAEKFAMKYAV